MRVRDLGPLTVSVDTRDQVLSGARAAAVMAMLTIHVNERVSVDALMDAVWGDNVSSGSPSTLESHVWRLRQLLEPGRDRRQAPSVLINDAGGYQLVGGPATIDSLAFAELAGELRDLLAAGHPETSVRRAESALALWRGRPYGSLGDAEWAQPAVARLDELHDQVQERRIEALLALGREDLALTDLRTLIAELPFRELLRVLQMEALYRTGRSEEALTAYQEARRVLRTDVGIEPGFELQEMHRRILRQDSSLNRPEPMVRLPIRPEIHLPAFLTPLVGRATVLDELAALLPDHRLVTVTGAAGCGKTRLAVEVARSATTDFPDGIWFVDLTAVTDPDLVVDVVISTIGFNTSPGATPVQDLRQYVTTRRMLVVLDNCEHVLDAVERLALAVFGDPAASPECCLLATSREPIGIEGETVWTLDPLDLPAEDHRGDPSSVAAVDLFLQRLSAITPTLPIDEHALTKVVEICRAVDGLPLPLELAAARALSHSLDDIALQVADDPSRLSRPGRGPSDHRRTVRSAIDWSHRLVSPAEQRAHRRLSVLPGAFTAALASAVVSDRADTGDEGRVDADVDDQLTGLVQRSLLTYEGTAGSSRVSSFRQLATVRSHARHALDEAGETARCQARRDAWTTALLVQRPPLGTAAEASWYGRIDHDYPSVRATLAHDLLDAPRPQGGRLAARLPFYWYYRQRVVEGGRWLLLGHDLLVTHGGRTPEDSGDLLLARITLAALLSIQGRVDLARSYLDGLSTFVHQAPKERLVEVGEALVGLANSLYVRDEVELLVPAHALLQWVVDEVADPNLGLLSDAVAACTLVSQGRFEQAGVAALALQDRADAADSPMAAYMAAAPLMVGALIAGDPAAGIPWVDRCLTAHLRLGDGATGMFIENRANFTALLGEYDQAARLYAMARTETRRAAMVWPRRPLTHELLAVTREHVSRRDFERAWQEGERLTVADVIGTEPPVTGDVAAPAGPR